MRRVLTVLLISLAFGLVLANNTNALNSAVSFEGSADKFVIYPGGDWSDSDLFGKLKGIMPGDKLTDTIKVRNNASEYKHVKIYLRADGEIDALLSQLHMRVQNGNKMIYDGTLGQDNSLKTNVLLGDFSYGDGTTLSITLSAPATLSSEYSHQSSAIDWIFTAEAFVEGDESGHIIPNNSGKKPKKLPQNAITFDNVIRFVVLLIVSAIGLFLAVVLIRHFKDTSKE